MVCWLMLLRFRVARPEDEVLQSWFLSASVLPMIPAIPGSMHIFDGFAYCAAFLLVRKARQDKLFSRLFTERPRGMRMAVAAWATASVFALGTVYAQIWKDGKSAHPELLLSAVAPQDETTMLAWMKANLPREGLVLAPEEMAPWVATIPMHSLASHDLFSITYENQRKLADRFYKGEDVRRDLIEAFGISYVVAPKSAAIQLAGGNLLHEEGSLRLYEVPGQRMKPYPGAAHLAGAAPQNAARQWVLRLFAFVRPSKD
jgi:hypothetical protein